MAELIVWRRLDCPGSDSARLEEAETGWKLSGTAIFTSAEGPSKLEYSVNCDSAWRTQSARVSGVASSKEIDVSFSVVECRWLLNNVECTAVQGCMDIDFDFTPSTNVIPIRRLALSRGAEGVARAAWFRLSSRILEPLTQTYRREGEKIYRYESAAGAFVRRLEVNRAGFVTRYPGLWVADVRRPTSVLR